MVWCDSCAEAGAKCTRGFDQVHWADGSSGAACVVQETGACGCMLPLAVGSCSPSWS